MGHVSDILQGKGPEVLAIEGSATVYDAIAKMVEGNVGALLVNEAAERIGTLVVTEDDEELPPQLEALRLLVGREPDLYEEFDTL